MSTQNITITSKNQITLPSEYVKALRLTKSRIMEAEIKDGKIVLSPQPALGAVMKKFWGKHHAQHAVSDGELKRAIRQRSAEKAAKAL